MTRCFNRSVNWRDVVLHTDSDSSNYILVLYPDNGHGFCIDYVHPGSYGGYLIRSTRLYNYLSDTGNAVAGVTVGGDDNPLLTAFIVNIDDEIIDAEYDDSRPTGRRFSRYDDLVNRVAGELARLPHIDDYLSTKYPTVYEITYTYTRVQLRIQRVTDRYIVVEPVAYTPPQRFTAKALRISFDWHGESLEALKALYPDVDVVQSLYLRYARISRRRSITYAVVKLVVETPGEEVPAPWASHGHAASRTATTPPAAAGAQPRAVLIRGFLVQHLLPTESLLETTLPEVFKNVVVGRKKVALATGYFRNWFKQFREKYYAILNKYAVKITAEMEATSAGNRERAIYILPASNVKPFLEEVDELRERLEVFERQLKDYLLHGKVPEGVSKRAKIDPEYIRIVREYLEKHGAWERVKEKIENLSLTDKFRVVLLPFAVSTDIIVEHLDDEVRRRIEREVVEFRNMLAEQARKRLTERVKRVIERLDALASTRKLNKKLLEELQREVEEIQRVAEDLGVDLPDEVNQLKKLAAAKTPSELVRRVAAERARLLRLRALLEW